MVSTLSTAALPLAAGSWQLACQCTNGGAWRKEEQICALVAELALAGTGR